MSLRSLARGVTFLATIWVGVMAGMFFAFTTLVMPSLATIDPAPAMASMQAMNAAVNAAGVTSLLFGLAFLGAALLSGLAGILALVRRSGVASVLIALGGVIYLLGGFLVTVTLNVPLNNDLARFDPSVPEQAARMTAYITDWSRWNDLRTAASVVAFVLLTIGLVLFPSEGAEDPAPPR